MDGGHAVFGYGSLVNPASLAATLGRPAPVPVAATLRGWRRRWSLVRDNERAEKGFAPADPESEPFDYCLGLNLERDESSWVNGALIELDEAEIARLDRREVRYDRVPLAHSSLTGPYRDLSGTNGMRVWGYVAKRENFAAEPPPRSVVLASYLAACEAAFDALGAGELERFRESTGSPPAPIVEALLVRDAIPPGNPRAW